VKIGEKGGRKQGLGKDLAKTVLRWKYIASDTGLAYRVDFRCGNHCGLGDNEKFSKPFLTFKSSRPTYE